MKYASILVTCAIALSILSIPDKINKVEADNSSVARVSKIKLEETGNYVINFELNNQHSDFVVGDSLLTRQQRAEEEKRKRDSDNAERKRSERLPSNRTVYSDQGAVNYAQKRVVEIWGEDQWDPFYQIINSESGWVVGKVNKSENCVGLGQACPGSKLGAARGSATGEVDFFIDYCKNRYQTPNKAWTFHKINNWW